MDNNIKIIVILMKVKLRKKHKKIIKLILFEYELTEEQIKEIIENKHYITKIYI